MGLIYKVTNQINNKIYKGKTTLSLEKRKKSHLHARFHKQTYFYSALNKYGINNFIWEILEDNIDNLNLNKREQFWINYYQSNNNKYGYNMTAGGDNTDNLNRWRIKNPELMHRFAKEGSKKMRTMLQENPELESKRKEKALIGIKKYAITHKEKLKQHGINIYLSHKEQQDKQMEEFHKQQSKKVICLNTKEIYPSMAEASRQTKISQGNISACCRGKRQSAGKHPVTKEKLYWEFYID